MDTDLNNNMPEQDEVLEPETEAAEPEAEYVLPDERSCTVEIAGESYRLLFTNGAMLAFAKELGGVERYLDQVKTKKEFSLVDILPDTLKALRILINQGIMFDNLANGTDRKLVAEEWLELVTNPGDIIAIRTATMNAIAHGMHRNIRSEDPEKKHPAE